MSKQKNNRIPEWVIGSYGISTRREFRQLKRREVRAAIEAFREVTLIN